MEDRKLQGLFGHPGGKSRYVDFLTPILPPHRVFIEPFVGSGALFFAKPKAPVNVLNDADPQIAAVFKNFSCPTLKRCLSRRVSRKLVEDAIGRFKKGSTHACDVLIAKKFTHNSAGLNPSRLKIDASQGRPAAPTILRNCDSYVEKLLGARILSTDYSDVVRRYDAKDSLTFMDPPYWGVDNTKYAFCGMTRHGRDRGGRPCEVTPEAVCGLARRAKGKVLITYNDHPQVRKACAGLVVRRIHYVYTSSQRQGQPAQDVGGLVIANFRLPKRLTRRSARA